MTDEQAAVARGIAALAEEASRRYGVPLVRVQVLASGVMGSVGLAAQEEAVRDLMSGSWPSGEVRILVLAMRRARVGLGPGVLPLKIWRSPLPTSRGERELTTELLPGDPPAALLAVFPDHLLVRAPGEAVGWVDRSAAIRFGPPPETFESRNPWDPELVLDSALGHLGRPYVWGGTGAEGLDCSGLVWRSFLEAGVLLPRNSRAQRLLGRRVRISELQPADLVAALSRGPARHSHVALALGPDEVVHACSETRAVRRETLRDFQDRYQVVAVRRLSGVHPDSR